MLILSRKKDESIVIAENIVITVTEISGDRVRIGIKAPRDLPVYRSEIQTILDQKKKAADCIAAALPTTEADSKLN